MKTMYGWLVLSVFFTSLIFYQSYTHMQTYDVLTKNSVQNRVQSYRTGCIDALNYATNGKAVDLIIQVCDDKTGYYKVGLDLIESEK